MKKLSFVFAILLVAIIIISCGKQTKGTLLGPCAENELSAKEKEDAKTLLYGDIFVNVLVDGDTIHAAMGMKDMEKHMFEQDMTVTVTLDGNNNDFYFVN